MISLRLEAVSRVFTHRRGAELAAAVDGVSLSVEPGELLVLIGPSGCGKTTLLRLIAGLDYPDEGEVYFNGEQVTFLPTRRRDLGMVFQTFALYPTMTIFQNMAFNLEGKGMKKQIIKEKIFETARLLDIEYLLNRRPRELSVGQRQRVALGRALVGGPSLLLLDEPLSNVDEQQRVSIRADIQQLQRQLGATTIYVTHDLQEAVLLADRIAVMKEGRLLRVGRPNEICSCNDNPFIRDFMSEVRKDAF